MVSKNHRRSSVKIMEQSYPQNEDNLSPMVDWYLESEATDILEWLCQKINIAMILNMENSICSKQVV